MQFLGRRPARTGRLARSAVGAFIVIATLAMAGPSWAGPMMGC